MFLRFLLVGGVGFVIDAGLTWLLVRLGADPMWARPPAIGVAMAFTWFANRTFTYAVKTARSWHEAARYFLLALAMSGVNYGIYLFLMQLGMGIVPAVALATGCQAVLSFYLYRHLVFKDRH